MNEHHIQFSRPPLVETGLNVTLDAPALTEDSIQAVVSEILPDVGLPMRMKERDSNNWIGCRYQFAENRFLTLQNVPSSSFILFSYSVTPAYKSWETFVTPARDALMRAVKSLRVRSVPGIGVRTINKIVPPPREGLSVQNFLKAGFPDVADLPKAGIMEFYLRDTSFYSSYGLYVRTIRTTQPTGANRPPDIIFDTDVFSAKPLQADLQGLDDLLARIREVRYKVFLGGVSDDYLEGCK